MSAPVSMPKTMSSRHNAVSADTPVPKAPLVAVHGYSFAAFVVLLAGISLVDHQLSNVGFNTTIRENGCDYLWFLLVAYACVMALHVSSAVVPEMRAFRLTIAFIIAILIVIFATQTNEVVQAFRYAREDVLEGDDFGDGTDRSVPHKSMLIAALRTVWAGSILCIVGLFAALCLQSVYLSAPAPAASAPALFTKDGIAMGTHTARAQDGPDPRTDGMMPV